MSMVDNAEVSTLEEEMNWKFLAAMEPYRDRIEAYFSTANGGSSTRLKLWVKVMGTLTDDGLNEDRARIIAEYASAGKKIVVVIPERAHPRLYLDWFIQFAEIVELAGGKLENTHLIFAGGVVGQVGTDGQMHSFADMYGELNGSAMDRYLRKASMYHGNFPPERVTCENLSKNTGDQAWIVAGCIMGSAAELVVFLGPNEHVARFALTIHKGLRTLEPVFRANYAKRIAAMKILVVPIFREGGWDAMTDLAGMTSAMDAFGPLDTDEERLRLFPKKQRGRELVERIGEEMYGEASKTFIMDVTPLEAAVADPMFSLEFTRLNG